MSASVKKRKIILWGMMFLMLSSAALTILTVPVFAQGRDHRPSREFMDSRYDHNRAYPMRDQRIGRLPDGHRVVVYRNSRYYFSRGAWYRPAGGRFIVVAPPAGMFVPFLPPFYVTLRVHGVPYYYANEVYYTPTAGGYIVAEAPKDDISKQPPANEPSTGSRLFIYPRQGQSEKQQADDRYACHTWAIDQTGYDPVKPPPEIPTDQLMQKRADYRRAMGACLEGRGYTVK